MMALVKALVDGNDAVQVRRFTEFLESMFETIGLVSCFGDSGVKMDFEDIKNIKEILRKIGAIVVEW